MNAGTKLALGSGLLAVVLIVAAVAVATPGSGVSAQILASGVKAEGLDVNRAGIDLKTKGAVQVVTQSVTLTPGATTGWHRHPGVPFATVTQGTVRLYRANCQARAFGPGQVFTHTSDDVHVVRNEGAGNAVFIVTYIKPSPTPALPNSVDEPAPAGCSVR